MEKQAITIYGYGYVGQAIADFFKDHYELDIIDPKYPELRKNFRTDYAIICAPTPMADDGSCDTSIVEEILKTSDHKFYLIKSTIKPGTTDRLIAETGKKIAFSPEYIGEGKYGIPFWHDFPHPTDMKLHSFHIFGGSREVTKAWVEIWQKVAGWIARYMQTEAKTAELVKYSENMFLATKNIFFQELYNVAGALGVDYNEMKELLLLDGRIGRAHTLVFPDKRGFGGKCLPKDTSALVEVSRAAGYDPEFFIEVIRSNKRIRGEEENDIKLGIYEHFKGGKYEVLGTAIHSETKEPLVIYKSLTEGKTWIRPIHIFLDKVKVNNQDVPRFKFLSEK